MKKYILTITAYIGFSFLMLLSPALLFSTTPHTIVIDGDVGEWHSDELIYDDSQNDSPWGSLNEIHRLWATWDENAFYLAVEGVQKDGNNLIVYIDTSPLDGIKDASVLMDPNDNSLLWWWRRGNKFSDGFRPDFQWQMYEMRLNVRDGHGLFRLYPDGKTADLNNLVEQKSSGGGSGVLSFAEIKIPWQVLYGDSAFPSGEELRVIACVTGGMDTMGTAQTSDDLYGSARDAIPDQTDDFSSVWYGTYTLTNYLTFKISAPPGGRSPIPRALNVYQTGEDSVRVEWRPRGVVEKNLSEYRVYYSSSGGAADSGGVYQPSFSTYTYVKGLMPYTTYQFCVKALYDIKSSGVGLMEGGASESVSVYMKRPSLNHTPQKIFCFPGKEITFAVNSSRPILSAVMKYASAGDSYYSSLVMSVAGSTASVTMSPPSGSTEIFYYFEITDALGSYRLPPLSPVMDENFYSTTISGYSSKFIFPSTSAISADFGGGVMVDIPPGSLLYATTVYFKYSTPDSTDDIYINGGRFSPLAYYDFYSQTQAADRRGIVFSKPVKVVLRYFAADVTGADENSLAVGRISDEEGSAVNDNTVLITNITRDTVADTVSFETEHFSRFVLLKTLSAPDASSSSSFGVLRKVIRPVFNPSLGEVVEFDLKGDVSAARIEIYDLNSRNIRSLGGKNFWDGCDSSGLRVPPGVYLWRIECSGEKIYGSCVVIR